MLAYVREGWKAATQQPFLLFVLFSYRLFWGIVLYRLVHSIVVPLLRRYPDAVSASGQGKLFFAESQFQLLKTDLIDSYLWLFLGLLLVRVIITPLLNAGIYYSLKQTQLHSGYRFFKGIRELGVSFMLLYVAQFAITLAPLYWLYPHMTMLLAKSASYESVFRALLPSLICYVLYGYLLHLGFIYLQFGRLWSHPIRDTLRVILQCIVIITCISLSLIILSLLLGTMTFSLAWIYTSLWVLMLYQAFHLARAFFDIWTLASQHELYLWKIQTG